MKNIEHRETVIFKIMNLISDQRVGYDNTAFNDGREMVEKRPDSRHEMERTGYDVYNGKRR